MSSTFRSLSAHWLCHLDWWWNACDLNAKLSAHKTLRKNNVIWMRGQVPWKQIIAFALIPARLVRTFGTLPYDRLHICPNHSRHWSYNLDWLAMCIIEESILRTTTEIRPSSSFNSQDNLHPRIFLIVHTQRIRGFKSCLTSRRTKWQTNICVRKLTSVAPLPRRPINTRRSIPRHHAACTAGE